MTDKTQWSAAQLRAAGLLACDDAVVQIRELRDDPLSGSGTHAIEVTLYNGLSFQVLPDRGLDIGPAWYRGIPLSWRSPLSSPGLAPTPSGWLGRFGGGLVVTCGLDNIGSPSESYGQHGSHHDTRAADVSVQRISTVDRGPGVRITGTVDSVEVFGRFVRTYRTIEAYADEPTLQLTDRVVNEGWVSAPVALLYHTNFGAPLVLPRTRVRVNSALHEVQATVPDIPRWESFPGPIERVAESCWEHAEFPGQGVAEIVSPTGLSATVAWDAAAQPRCIQWVFPTRGRWALGIEPSNAPLWGPKRDAEDRGAPSLAPGEELTTRLSVTIGRLSASLEGFDDI